MRQYLDLLPLRYAKRIRVTAAGCWEWVGARTSSGYGNVWVGSATAGRTHVTHRVIYELLVGPIPEGLTLDHLCRNRPCCNPCHLEPVTGRENTLRGQGRAAQQARQTHCIHGHPLDLFNAYVDTRGKRVCRTCRDVWSRERNAGRRPASVSA